MSKELLKKYKADYAAYINDLQEYRKKEAAHTEWFLSAEKAEMDDLRKKIENFHAIPEFVASEHVGWNGEREAYYCLSEKIWCTKSTKSSTSASSDGMGVRTTDYTTFKECDYTPTLEDKKAVAEAAEQRERLVSKKADLLTRLAELEKKYPEPAQVKMPELGFGFEYDGATWFHRIARDMGYVLKKKVEGPCGLETVEVLDFPTLCRILNI